MHAQVKGDRYGRKLSNLFDSDGSLSGTGRPTLLAAREANRWWRLDDRPHVCEEYPNWVYPMWVCGLGPNLHLGSAEIMHHSTMHSADNGNQLAAHL